MTYLWKYQCVEGYNHQLIRLNRFDDSLKSRNVNQVGWIKRKL